MRSNFREEYQKRHCFQTLSFFVLNEKVVAITALINIKILSTTLYYEFKIVVKVVKLKIQ